MTVFRAIEKAILSHEDILLRNFAELVKARSIVQWNNEKRNTITQKHFAIDKILVSDPSLQTREVENCIAFTVRFIGEPKTKNAIKGLKRKHNKPSESP